MVHFWLYGLYTFDCTEKLASSKQMRKTNRRRLEQWRLVPVIDSHKQNDACIQPKTQTNKQKTTSTMIWLYKRRPAQWQTKQRRPAQGRLCTLLTVQTVYCRPYILYTFEWTDCTLLTVQTHTNKQPTPQTWRALWLYTLTKWCCTLLTVQTVHFWLYRLFTVDCTDCTLLTLQSHTNKQTKS